MLPGMILSGDIGGTKAELALFERDHGSLREVRSERIPTDGHGSLEELLGVFLHSGDAISSAAFGIAGPVLRSRRADFVRGALRAEHPPLRHPADDARGPRRGLPSLAIAASRNASASRVRSRIRSSWTCHAV